MGIDTHLRNCAGDKGSGRKPTLALLPPCSPHFFFHIYIYIYFILLQRLFPPSPCLFVRSGKSHQRQTSQRGLAKKTPCTQSAEVAIDERLNKNRRRKTQFLAGVGKQEWFICLKKKSNCIGSAFWLYHFILLLFFNLEQRINIYILYIYI